MGILFVPAGTTAETADTCGHCHGFGDEEDGTICPVCRGFGKPGWYAEHASTGLVIGPYDSQVRAEAELANELAKLTEGR